MDILIRKAKKDDLDEILDLLLQTARIHHYGRPDIFKDNSRKYSKDEFYEILDDDKKPVFVAQDTATKKVVGYAFCQMLKFEERAVLKEYESLYLDDLCVDEKFRGNGIGKRIMDYLKEYAKTACCYNIELNVWDCNKAAIDFYEKNGLVTQRRRYEWIVSDKNE